MMFSSVTAAQCQICFVKGKTPSPKAETSGALSADTVLVKHDENYMPREVIETLKKQVRWRDEVALPVSSAR